MFKGGATWSGKNGARKVKLLGNQKRTLKHCEKLKLPHASLVPRWKPRLSIRGNNYFPRKKLKWGNLRS